MEPSKPRLEAWDWHGGAHTSTKFSIEEGDDSDSKQVRGKVSEISTKSLTPFFFSEYCCFPY
jgi:hypothetical protein